MNTLTLKRRCKRNLTIMLSLILMFIVTGCGKEEKKKEEVSYNGTLVFTYGNNYVTKGEVYIYLMTISERYVSQYGEAVWETMLPMEGTEETIPMEEAVKQETVEEIVRVKTLVAQAEDFKVVLTEADQARIHEDAELFFHGLTDDNIAKMELDEDVIYKVYSENEIANRVKEQLLYDDPVEISDEEARMTTFYDMYFHCYGVDENGVMTPYTEEEKKIQYENALSACSTLATANIDENQEAENIAKLAEYYKLTEAGEYTMSPQDILDVYGENVHDFLYSMEPGDYSAVMETEYGYHVFQMIELTDQRATQARKEAMTEEAINEQLASNLDKWQKKIDSDFAYPESIDMNVYNTITVN